MKGPMQPNMKKEYRAELKSVRKQLGALTRETRWAQKRYAAEIKKIDLSWRKLFRRNERAGARLLKRQQILEGRLS